MQKLGFGQVGTESAGCVEIAVCAGQIVEDKENIAQTQIGIRVAVIEQERFVQQGGCLLEQGFLRVLALLKLCQKRHSSFVELF